MPSLGKIKITKTKNSIYFLELMIGGGIGIIHYAAASFRELGELTARNEN
jgi:hypothetical protein